MRVAWILAVGVLLAVPAAAQEPGPADGVLEQATTLYVHLHHIQDMPITTQEPAASFRSEAFYGLATTTLTCLPDTVGGLNTYEYQTWRGFGFSGHLDYTEDPPRQVFDNYGPTALTADVVLTGDRITLHWFLSAQMGSAAPTGLPHAPIPGVVIEATLRTGQGITVDPEATWDEGELLANGRTAPAFLAGEQTSGATFSTVDGRAVYGFEVTLDVAAASIPADAGYNLRVDAYQLADECPADGYLMSNTVAAHTSPEHRPRLVLVADDAPVVQVIHAGALRADGPRDRIAVAANLTSPWGNHDVASMHLAIRSADGGFEATSVLLAVPPMSVHCHCPPTPLMPLWIWDAGLDDAPAGTYVATVTATSRQGEATTASHEFELRAEHESPGWDPVVPILLLAGLAVLLRRRR